MTHLLLAVNKQPETSLKLTLKRQRSWVICSQRGFSYLPVKEAWLERNRSELSWMSLFIHFCWSGNIVCLFVLMTNERLFYSLSRKSGFWDVMTQMWMFFPHTKNGICVPHSLGLGYHLTCTVLFDFMDRSPPGSSVDGIPQARILAWVSTSFCRGSSWPRDCSWISCIGRWILPHWATRELGFVTLPNWWIWWMFLEALPRARL